MFQNLLKRIARQLAREHIPYMIIGGQAVLLYGEPRLTKDIDITLGVGVDELEKMKRVIGTAGLKVLVDNVEDFVNKTMVLPVADERSGIKVDFVFSFSPYEKEAIERANNIKIGKTVVKFASLEDIVIHKIVAGRPRDIEDVRSILLKNPHYNAKYINSWLQQFDRSLDQDFTKVFRKLAEETRKQ